MPQLDSPVPVTFLICSERSGSNLISSILNSHPLIESTPPYHLCRDIGLNLHRFEDSDLKSSCWVDLIDSFTGRIAELNAPSTAKNFADWYSAKDSVSFPDLMRFIFCDLTKQNDKTKCIFIKENNIHEMFFFLLDTFPDARFVFQVRDPRDFLLSALQLKEGTLGNKFGSNMQALETWRSDQLGGLRALAHLGPTRVFYQKYEDLVCDPTLVLTSLCRFLGLEYSDDMLGFHKSQSANRLAVPGGPRANLSKPLLTSNFAKYKTQMPRELIVMVESYLGDLMARFGYEKEFPNERYTLSQIMHPRLMESLEMYANRQLSPFYSFNKWDTDAGDPLRTEY